MSGQLLEGGGRQGSHALDQGSEEFAGASTRLSGRALDIALGIHRLLPQGGLEDNCIRIADELKRRGHRVTIFVGGEHSQLDVPIVPLIPPRQSLFNHVRAARFSRDFIAETTGKFDRTVAFQPTPGADVLFIADRLRDRSMFNPLRWLHPRFYTYASLEKGCFRRGAGTRIIGVAEPQVASFVERYGTEPERVAVLPPAIAAEKHRPESRTAEARARVRRELGIPGDATVWLWLALQPRVKGLDRVLAALKLDPRTHLLVGGVQLTNKKAQMLKVEAERMGIADRVHWVGYLSGGGFHDHMAAADVLAHPARLEVAGAVILEAIANGLPVVATSVCGFAKHIETSRAGKIVGDPFDLVEFVECLAEVTGPSNAEYSAAGIRYGASTALFSGTKCACDLIEAHSWRNVTWPDITT